MAYRYQQGPPRGAQPGDILVVVHDFDARSADELTLRRGDRIELVELDEGFGDGWYLGKHLGRDGNGLFPGVYTAIVAGHPKVNNNSSFSPSVVPSNMHSTTSVPTPQSQQPVLISATPAPITTQDDNPQPSRHTSSTSTQRPTSSHSAKVSALQQLDTNRSPGGRSLGTASIPSIQRSINETIGTTRNGEGSPVMNETLSVIDEHITDLSTPRDSLAQTTQHAANDSSSEYSENRDRRLSYIAGPDTDEEDEGQLTEHEVRRWDHKQTAQHLRSIGVEPQHCQIFEEQEISGDLLLDMDQAFVHMKEYDFGVAGRRLKTWHKIRAFQEEIKGSPTLHNHSLYDGSSEDLDRSQSRLGHTGTLLPRIPSLVEKPSPAFRQSRGQTPTSLHDTASPTQGAQSPGSPRTTRSQQSPWPAGKESPGRPSAASIRNISHSRRHSSMDTGTPGAEPTVRANTLSGKTLGSHQKQSSFDRNWSMTSAVPTLNNTTSPPVGSLAQALHGDLNSSDPNLMTPPSANVDLDRGYFSGGEVESRRHRNVLRKRDSTGSATHSRHSSLLEDPKRSAPAVKRHSRFGSADSIRDLVPSVTSSASKAYHSNSTPKGRFRSASAKTAVSPATMPTSSPTVTKLEGQDGSSQGYFGPTAGTEGGHSTLSSLTSRINPAKARRIVGLRAISDAVTGQEKALVTSSPTSMPSPIKEDSGVSPARTGSSTPSAASKSLDNDTTDVSSKGTESPFPMPPPKVPARGKTKSKKETSAYVRGLQKKTPAEQKQNCDYYGWMKKKSSSLMTTWKPRLFILKGRRLSYYYSEEDTEERGIIDISGHRVLNAAADVMNMLHATITGSMSSPVAPHGAEDSTSAPEREVLGRIRSDSEGPFFFKLVPPRSGLSRAVQFTKPTVHYFQVDSATVGRMWMGEIMKATIEHDFTIGITSTNKQKTISLAKARARQERPPALKGENPNEIEEGPKSDETGLNIRNLSFDEDGAGNLENGLGLVKKSSLEAIGAFIAQSTDDANHEGGDA